MPEQGVQRIEFDHLKDNREILTELASSKSFELVLESSQVEKFESMTVPTPNSLAIDVVRKLIENSNGELHYKDWIDSVELKVVVTEVIQKRSIDFLTAVSMLLRGDPFEVYNGDNPFRFVHQTPEHRIYQITVYYPVKDPQRMFEDYAYDLLICETIDVATRLVNELSIAAEQIADYDVRLLTEKPDFKG